MLAIGVGDVLGHTGDRISIACCVRRLCAFYQIGPQFQRFAGHVLSDAARGINDHRRKAFEGQGRRMFPGSL